MAPGDFLSYDLTVSNMSRRAAASGVRIIDMMPPGFRYRTGSATINNMPASDPSVSADGQNLIFPVGLLGPEASAVVRFVAEVTAGSRIGTSVNYASAISDGGGTSNIAKAPVSVRDDLLRTRSILMGRVTRGACPSDNEEPQDGQDGIRVYLEDGTFVVSDKEGMFHFEAVSPGLHVVQLDLDSLPDGFEALPCTENSRFAGRAFSQFVEVQGGTLWRTDFHIARSSKVPAAASGGVTGEHPEVSKRSM